MTTRRRAWPAIAAMLGALIGLAEPAIGASDPAKGTYTIDLSEGWTSNERLGQRLAVQLSRQPQLDGTPVDLGVGAYASPLGLMVYVTWIFGREPDEDPGLRMRRAFDELRAAPERASPRIGSAELVSWTEDVDDTLAEASLVWRHLSNETVTHLRAVMWASPEGALRQVRAECLLAADATAAQAAACEAVLASLAVAVPAAERGALGTAPGAGSLKLADDDDDDMLLVVEPGDGPDRERPADSDPPSLRPPTEGAVPYEAAPLAGDGGDSNALYLGGALLLIVALYLFMRARAQRRTHALTDRTGVP